MTDYQMKQIREFRLKGVGYKAIASVTGLSRDIVRNYCKSNNLDGHSEVVPINLQEKMKQGTACMNCGEDMIQPTTGRRKKYCSSECRRTYWKNHSHQINRKETAFYEKCCVYCGDDFKVYGNKGRKYCSHECYVRDRFWREEDGRDPYTGPTDKEERRHE